MYLHRRSKAQKGKTYTNYLLVESVHPPKGARQHVVCSLGSLAPAPREEWLSLAHRLKASLQGQGSLPPSDPQIATLVEKMQQGRRPATEPERTVGASLRVERSHDLEPSYLSPFRACDAGLDAAYRSGRYPGCRLFHASRRCFVPQSGPAAPDAGAD